MEAIAVTSSDSQSLSMKQRFASIHALTFVVGNAEHGDHASRKKGNQMFLILAVVLVLLWLGLFVGLHVAGFFIHLLILFAIISVIMHFVSGSKRAA
jgi:hypothetical protein